MLLGSLDRFVEQRIRMYKAVILLRQWKFVKVSLQIKKTEQKNPGKKSGTPNGRDDLPAFGGHWSLRLQGRQYYIQCNR